MDDELAGSFQMGYERLMDLIASTAALAEACRRLAGIPSSPSIPSFCARPPTIRSSASCRWPLRRRRPRRSPGAGDGPGAVPCPDGRRSGGQGLPFGPAGPRNRLESRRLRAGAAVRHPGCRDGLRLRRFGLLRAIVKRPRQGANRKSSRFTDWSRRPLTEAQLVYALSDVTHLVVFTARLRDLGGERPPGPGSRRRWPC